MFLYWSPCQRVNSVDSFLEDVKLKFDAMTDNNLFLVVKIGDFNVRSSNRCINDKSNYKGSKTDLATQYDLKEIIVNIYISIKFSEGSRRPFIITRKLSLARFTIPHLMKERFSTSKKLISILLEGQ